MEVLVIHRQEAMRFDIYVKLGEDKENRTSLFQTIDGPLLVGSGQEAPVYMMMPADIFEAIIGEGRKQFPPEKDDVREHLADTIDVRDRMIRLVEVQFERMASPVHHYHIGKEGDNVS